MTNATTSASGGNVNDEPSVLPSGLQGWEWGLIGGGVALLVLLVCIAVACIVRKRANEDVRRASGGVDNYFGDGDRDVVLVNYDFDDGKDDMPPPPLGAESPSLKALSNDGIDGKKSAMASDLQIETINADSSD